MKFYITEESAESGSPDIWGISQKYDFQLNNNNFTYDYMLDICGGSCYYQSDTFIDEVTNSGILPPGGYKIEYTLWENLELYADWFGNSNFVEAKLDKSLSLYSQSPIYSNSQFIINQNVSEINIVSPIDEFSVQSSNPSFEWDTPGFSNGVEIIYRLRVYLFHPEYHSSKEEAIEDENYLFYDTGWDEQYSFIENGVSQRKSISYSSTAERDLICGFNYVWFIEARDNNDNEIWGWPEPVRSKLNTFTYGNHIVTESVISPQINSIIETVRPTFNVEPVSCADAYEIWLSYSEDSEVENPIWISDDLQTSINDYPYYANGLAPAGNYKWKIRINPNGEPGPWSEIFDFSIIDYSLDEPSSMQELNTVTPTFYFSGPADIASYELRISNSDDSQVEFGNIFSQNILSLPFELPLDWADGILPDMNYFWKLIFIDGNENIIGSIDDYNKVESFKISSIDITTPFDGASNLSLTPSFMWSGPIGVSQYEISISSESDPTVQNPFYINQVSGTFFQYPQLTDSPLEYNSLYFWNIVPLDMSENRGVKSEVLSFSTALDFNSVIEESNSIKPEFILVDGSDNSPKNININLLAGVAGADEYQVYFSYDQSMDVLLGDLLISSDQVVGTYDGNSLEWGSIVYVQIAALSDGENIGEISSVQFLNLPSKPGSNDQVGIVVNLDEGSLYPEVSITNIVNNATQYEIKYANDIEMSEIIYTNIFSEDLNDIYNSNQVKLQFGETYYIQVHAFDNEGIHGIPSTVTALFIPNIIPAVLNEPFSWNPTVPESDLYNIQVSTTDDFTVSSIVVDSLIENTSISIYNDLTDGITYYWRIRGIDMDGNFLGDYSTVGLYDSGGIQEQLDDIEGGLIVSLQSPVSGEQISTLNPTFKWEGIESAERYQIQVTSDENFSTIIWDNANVSQNSVPYPSTGSDILSFDETYYWRVRAIAYENPLGAYSQLSTFTITNDYNPKLLGPVDEISESILPFFSWEKIPQASSYGLILGSNESFNQIIFENQSISDKQFQYTVSEPPLENGINYFWKVIAYDQNGESLGDYSATADLVLLQESLKLNLFTMRVVIK